MASEASAAPAAASGAGRGSRAGTPQSSAGAKDNARPSVGFLLTEVDIEAEQRPITPAAEADLAPVVTSDPGAAALPLISVYRVEDAELPSEVISDGAMPAPLPPGVPMDKVMTNVVQNLDLKAWSEHARSMWFKVFKSQPSRAVISDTFWFCIIWYFKSGKHGEAEKRLFDRISANFVWLFSTVPATRKDFFFRFYADAVAQAVLYSMFLAYPKSRVYFTEKFRKDLVSRVSYWTTGVHPEFVDAKHWKLNLGGGNVLNSTSSSTWQKGGSEGGRHAPAGGAHPALGHLGLEGPMSQRSMVSTRAPRKAAKLRYSPLVAHFMRSRKYSSVNLIRPTCMSMTTVEERAHAMDVKHKKLVDGAVAARERCDAQICSYNEMCAELRRQERKAQTEAQATKKTLEIRRKEVLRSDPREYANYLVSLHLLQQGMGQGYD